VAFGEGPLEGKLVGKEGEVRLPLGQEVKVYGGQNELVRFHVEGLLALPGLFTPNLWGQLSLGLLWIMEIAFRYTGSWGLAILFLTLVVRLLLWPLMHQQFKSMAEMQRLQPLIQKINEKYKDDPNKRAEATMKLYQEHKVNPAAGCLPLFIQMPILFILWKVIANYEFGQGLLWIPDLALPDPYYILPVLYVASTLLSTWLSAHGNKDLIRQSLFINLIFIFLVLQFPAGVTLYWVLSNLIGLFQQWLINKSLKPLAA
jgi:Preprotein translocase subunit YidC